MKMLGPALPAIVTILMSAPPALSDELLPPDRPIAEVVDHYVDAKLAGAGVAPAPRAEDATLARRVTLDLVGRIPAAAESRAFLESTDPDKLAKLVDRLMASPGFVRHQADAFDAMLMAGGRGSVREYLARAFGEGRPWDRIFRDLLEADEADAARKGSAEFLKARVQDLDRMTNDVSSIFFGVNVSCAKCHDHPRVRDWKQDHYYGMKSFLGRTFQNGEFVAERGYGDVKFLTTEGKEKQARFQFLTGRVVDLPGDEPSQEARKEEKDKLEEAKKQKVAPPAPKVSARGKLVEIALEPGERDFFARSIVNRLWGRVFGTGLVAPLDQMHSANPPSHPELLSWLARDTINHGYDLRRLVRGLITSRAYARSSRWESGEPPDASLFAAAAVRPLTAHQLATSMWVATADPAALPGEPSLDELDRKLEDLAGRARGLAESIARPGETYQIGAAEALLMSNSDRLEDLLAGGGDRLVGRLARITDRRERIDTAVRNVLSRPPDAEELALLDDFLPKDDARAVEGCRQLVWALLTDAEFRFNY